MWHPTTSLYFNYNPLAPELNQHLPIMSLMTINVPHKPFRLHIHCHWSKLLVWYVTESSPSLQNPTNTSMHYNNTIEFEIQRCVHQLMCIQFTSIGNPKPCSTMLIESCNLICNQVLITLFWTCFVPWISMHDGINLVTCLAALQSCS
jgi:hypothetical protein